MSIFAVRLTLQRQIFIGNLFKGKDSTNLVIFLGEILGGAGFVTSLVYISRS